MHVCASRGACIRLTNKFVAFPSKTLFKRLDFLYPRYHSSGVWCSRIFIDLLIYLCFLLDNDLYLLESTFLYYKKCFLFFKNNPVFLGLEMEITRRQKLSFSTSALLHISSSQKAAEAARDICEVHGAGVTGDSATRKWSLWSSRTTTSTPAFVAEDLRNMMKSVSAHFWRKMAAKEVVK